LNLKRFEIGLKMDFKKKRKKEKEKKQQTQPNPAGPSTSGPLQPLVSIPSAAPRSLSAHKRPTSAPLSLLSPSHR
jgi:hypothetical protein